MSLTLFLFIAFFVSLAVARSLGATSAAKAVRAGETAAADALSTLSTAPYDQLAAGTFTPPDNCNGAPSTGVRSDTCTTVGSSPITISYQYMTPTDANGTTTCSDNAITGTSTAATYGYVGICAKVLTINGAPAPDGLEPVQKRINSPSPKYSPQGGVVRVTVAGDSTALPTKTLYLVKTSNPGNIVGTGTLSDVDNVAYIATSATGCTSADPCMVALAPTSSPALIAGYGLYGPGARPGANIVTGAGLVRDTSVSIGRPPTLRLDMVARNGASLERLGAKPGDGVPSVTSTACIWATFDDSGTQSSALCNSADPSVATASTYTITYPSISGTTTATFPLPPSRISLSTDSPDGRCPNVGQNGYTSAGSGGVAPAAVCTSWTWGSPTNLPTTVMLKAAETARQNVVWDAVPSGVSAPAAGWPGQPGNMWAHPRPIPACASDGTCTPVNAAPEKTWCPGSFCTSPRPGAPYLSTPLDAQIIPEGTSSTFTVSGVNPSGAGLYAYIGAYTGGTSVLPAGGGTLSASGVGTLSTLNTRLLATGGSGGSWTFTYTRPNDYSGPITLNVRLCPTDPGGNPSSAAPTCTGGTTRGITLLSSSPAGTLNLDSVSGPQSGTVLLNATLTDPITGAGVGGTAVEFSLNGRADIQAGWPTPILTGADGTVSVPVIIRDTATTGPISVTTTGAGSVSATATMTVLPTPRGLSVSAVNAAVPFLQGTAVPVRVRAADAANNPIVGVPITFNVTTTTAPITTSSTVAATRGCTTGTDGTCTTNINVDGGAKIDNYQINATYSGLVGSMTIRTVAALGTVVTANPDQTIGASSGPVAFTLNMFDQAGTPLASTTNLRITGTGRVGPGTPVSPYSTPLSAVVSTDASGQTSVNVWAAPGTPEGVYTFTVVQETPNVAVADRPSATFEIRVTTNAANLNVVGSPAVAQGGTSTLVLQALDATTGTPMAGHTVYIDGGSTNIQVASSALTGVDGKATFSIYAKPEARAGIANITAQLDSRAPITVPILVQSTISTVSVNGYVNQGSTGVAAITVYDMAGDVQPNVPVSVTPTDTAVASSLSFTAVGGGPQPVSTNSSGVANFAMVNSVILHTGQYPLTLQAGSVTIRTAVISVKAVAGSFSTPSGNLVATEQNPGDELYTIFDRAGDPMPSAPVAVAWDNGVNGPANVLGVSSKSGDGANRQPSGYTYLDGNFYLNAVPTAGTTNGIFRAKLTSGNISTTRNIDIRSSVAPTVQTPTVVGKNSAVQVSWTAAVGTFGAGVDYYRATAYTSPALVPAGTCDGGDPGPGPGGACIISGLSNGTNYVVSVLAHNAQGFSNPATSAVFSPAGVPTAPTSLTVTGAGTNRTATWSPPSIFNSSTVSNYVTSANPVSGMRVNQEANPSFENGLNGTYWSVACGLQCTSSASTEAAFVGTHSMKATSGSGRTYNQWYPEGGSIPNIVGGHTYTFSFYSRAKTVGRSILAYGVFWGAQGQYAGGAYLGEGGGTPVLDTTTGWTRSTYTFVAPPGTAYFMPRIMVIDATRAAGEVHYFDGIMFEEAPSAGTYFDGSLSPASWTGAVDGSFSVQANTDRANLLPNPSGEAGAGGWTASTGTTLTGLPSTQAVAGTSVIKATTTTTGVSTISLNGADVSGATVLSGKTYTFSTQILSKGTARSATASILWYGPTGTLLTTTTGTTNAYPPANQWYTSSVSAAAPAGAVFASVKITLGGAVVPAGDVFYLDAAMFEPSSTVGTFFDGSSTNSYWTGISDSSPSVYSAPGAGGVSCTPVGVTCSLGGLNTSVAYWAQTYAKTAGGGGNAGPWTVSAAAPSAPTNVSISPTGVGTGTVSWVSPNSNGGAAIISYTVSATSSSAATGTCNVTAAAATLSCNLAGLASAPDTWTATVRATNAAGDSVESAPSAATGLYLPTSAPGVPTLISADQSLNATTTAPGSTNGSNVTTYNTFAKPASVFRTNLAKNPAMNTNSTGWTGGSSTYASGVNLVGSAGAVNFKGNGVNYYTYPYTDTAANTVSAGDIVTSSAYMKRAAGTAATRAYVSYDYYNGSTYLSSSSGPNFTLTADTWTRVSFTPSTGAPNGTTWVRAIFLVSNSTSTTLPVTDNYYLDGALIEKTGTVGTYFDGFTPGASWTGTANSSSSIIDSTTRTNYAPNPSFETGLTGWTGEAGYNSGNSAISRVSGGNSGTFAMSVNLAGADGSCEGVNSGGTYTTLLPNTTYTFTSSIKGAAGQPIQAVVRDTTNSIYGDNLQIVADGTWQNLSSTITTGTNGPVTVLYTLRNNCVSPSATTFLVDSTRVEIGGSTGTYFDGDSAGAYWSGSADSSPSIFNTTAAAGTCTSATLTCNIMGLSNGTAYYTRTYATNAAGPGTASAWSASANAAVPTAAPGAPNLTATTTAGTMIASWAGVPTTGGAEVTNYTATADRLARTNLLSNPSFETNTSGWLEREGKASSTRTNTPTAAVGAYSVAVSTTGTTPTTVDYTSNSGAGAFSVTPGTTYTAQVRVRANTTTRAIVLGMSWQVGDTFYKDTNGPAGVEDSANGWTTYTYTAAAPSIAAGDTSDATKARIHIIIAGTENGETHYIDGAQVEAAPTMWPYFDGSFSSVGGTWTGTANASTSTIAPSAAVTSCSTATNMCNLTGLNTSTVYSATVKASNAAGWSPNSAASVGAVPAIPPTTAQTLAVTPAAGGVNATWAAPSTVGGPDSPTYLANSKLASEFRTNLLTNPGFEIGNTSGWGAYNSTMRESISTLFGRTYSMVLSANAGSPHTWANNVAVTVGDTYTYSVWIKPSATRSIGAALSWRDSGGGSSLPRTGPSYTSVPAGVWTRLTVTGTAPTGAVSMYPYVFMTTDTVAGDTFAIDSALLEKSATVGTFFDGYTPGASWTGTTANSTSVLDTTIRTNYAPTTSFETGLDQTVPYTSGVGYITGGTSWLTTTGVDSGTRALHLSAASILPGGRHGFYMDVPVSGGGTYTFSAKLSNFTGTNKRVRMYIDAYSKTGILVAAETSSSAEGTLSVSTTAPDTVAYLRVLTWLEPSSGTATNISADIDSLMVEKAPSVGAFFNGSSTNAYWNGLEESSASVLNTTLGLTCTSSGLTCATGGGSVGEGYYTRVVAGTPYGYSPASPWSTQVTAG